MGKLGVLQSLGQQRVRHVETEQQQKQQQEYKIYIFFLKKLGQTSKKFQTYWKDCFRNMHSC